MRNPDNRIESMKPLKDLIKPRRITSEVPQSKIEKDLEIFQRMAIDLGATDAAVVSSDGRTFYG